MTEGQPLHWENPCLTYTVQLDGSPRAGLDADQVQALTADAFTVWEQASCATGGTPRFAARFQGYVSCDRKEAVCGGASQNDNVVMIHDRDWPYGPGAIGVTTPSGGVDSGTVSDTDVELNAENFAFTTGPPTSSATSIRYTLTHELGHFLGLAHSDVEGSADVGALPGPVAWNGAVVGRRRGCHLRRISAWTAAAVRRSGGACVRRLSDPTRRRPCLRIGVDLPGELRLPCSTRVAAPTRR